MKTIIHLLNTGSFSGAENVVITLIRQMRKRYGNEYRFLYVSRPGSIEERVKKENIEFLPIEKISIKEIKKIKRKYNPDLIHAHDFTASMVCAMAFISTPIISHLHSNPLWMQSYNIKSWAYYITAFRYQMILSVSAAIKEEYVFGEKIKRKLHNIGNPVDVKAIADKAEDKCMEKTDMVFLGRLSAPKDPLRFINIVAGVVKSDSSITCAMIGDGELREACIKEVERLGLEKNVHLMGFLENPYPLLKNAKLLCITSKWEGFGLMAVEALSLGVPVVSTYIGGLKNIINESCGCFCNTDEQFIRQIKEILDDEELQRKLSKGAVQRAKELDNIYQYTGELDEIYNRILGKGIKR